MFKGQFQCSLALGCFVLLLTARSATGQNPSDHFQFETWKVDRGLPQNAILSLLQTEDGYLWIGTRFGLARFDGVRFTVFNTANTPEMASENCAVLAEDTDDTLWIGTRRGLLRRVKNRFQLFTREHGLSDDGIRSLSPSRDGGIWIGTDSGFCRFHNGVFTDYSQLTQTRNLRVQVHVHSSGSVLFSTTNGVFRFIPSTRAVELLISKNHEAGTSRAHTFYETTDQQLWLGNSTGLFGINGTNVAAFPPRSRDVVGRREPTRVDVVCRSRSGDLWVTLSANRILHMLQNGRYVPFTFPEGEPIKGVQSVIEDREGNIWVGTTYDGLVRLQRRFISMITTRHGLGSENTWSICEDAEGTIWAGTRELSLNRIRDGEVKSYVISDEPHDIAALLPTGSETLWVGVKQPHDQTAPTLYRFENGEFTDFNAEIGLHTPSVSALWKDRAGHLWIGTPNGLIRWRSGERARFTTKNGLPHNDVRAILEDRAGDLWFATYGGGICRLHNGHFTTFDTAKGLSSDTAWELHEDADGVLWIGTQAGLNRFKDGRFFIFTRRHGLFDDLVNRILEDDFGFFWISCNRGIYRVSRAELNAVADGKQTSVKHFAYGAAEGMASSETNGENQPAGCKARDGTLWFPTIQGVAVINPSRVPTNEVTPPLVIEQVIADGEVLFDNGLKSGLSLEPHADLAPGRARVFQIHFTANSFMAPDKVDFQYRLNRMGAKNAEWRRAGRDRVAYYTNLRPGKYTFEVTACNNHGKWNPVPASYSMTLAPHFYQRISFYVACALLALTTGYGAHRLRIRIFTRLKELEKFRAIELERGRIAKDMHDDLGSSLTQISLRTELASRSAREPEDFRTHLQQLGDIARSVLQSLDEIVWATNPRNDTLEGLVSFFAKFGPEFLRLANLPCRLNIPPVLPHIPASAEIRHNLYLVVKEALTNIVKHSQATEVWLWAQWNNPILELTIEDNGTGVHPKANGDGDGIRNMEQRLRAIKGTFLIESREGGGTRLRLRVPLFS